MGESVFFDFTSKGFWIYYRYPQENIFTTLVAEDEIAKKM